jgi:hypothetical protein
MDTTLAMAQRLLSSLEEYLGGTTAARRLELLRHVRGDWAN